MNNEEKIFNLLEKVYIDLQETKDRLGNVENGQKSITNRLSSIENTVVRIENDHGQKLDALFDGYKQNSEKLDRIEKQVAKHEEIIMRKI